MFFDSKNIAECTAPEPCSRHAKLIFDQKTIESTPLSMAIFRFEPGQTGPQHHHETEVEVYYGL